MPCRPNNLAISGVSLLDAGGGKADIQFTKSWDNSWHEIWTESGGTEIGIPDDGGGSLYEWVADTDPNDPLSKLALQALRRGAAIELDFGTTSEKTSVTGSRHRRAPYTANGRPPPTRRYSASAET